MSEPIETLTLRSLQYVFQNERTGDVLMHDYYDTMRKMTGKDSEQDVEAMLVDIAFALDQSAIVAITDRTGKITYVNELFTKISKYKADELIGATHSIINSGYHPKEFFKNMWATIGTREDLARGNL